MEQEVLKEFNSRDYNVKDILRIFNLNYNFTEQDVKKSYKKVLMLHPDKSGLHQSVFLFYSKAFKQLNYIYEFKTKHRVQDVNIQYEKQKMIYNEDNENIQHHKEQYKTMKHTNDNFNKNFNKLFDKVKDKEENTYDEWFRSSEVIETQEIKNTRDMSNYFEKKKRELSNHNAIIKNDILDLGELSHAGTNLVKDDVVEYSSGLFSKLRYEDLKKAHTETIVPVHEGMIKRDRDPSNLEAYKRERSSKIHIPTKEESNRMLLQNQEKIEKESMNRAYKLYREMEEIDEKNKIINSYRYLLK